VARIRSIKPEITTDRKLVQVSLEARLTFIYTWTIADDDGYFRAEQRQLLGALFPHDSRVSRETLAGWLEELVSIGVLCWRTTNDGSRVGQIVNWAKHQKIDHKSASFIAKELQPLTTRDRTRSPEALAKRSRVTRETIAPRVQSPESRSSTRPLRESWLTPYSTAWVRQYGGKPSAGPLAHYLKPLHDQHGLDKTIIHWKNYLVSTEARFASPARFSTTFGSWSTAQVHGLPPGVKPEDPVYDDNGQPTAAGRAIGL
jgi:hypothetical protein